jgi:rRNA-processing protein FCF1
MHKFGKIGVFLCIRAYAFAYNVPKGGLLKPINMFNDENKASSLAKFLNGFDYVIVDTCSLMEDSFPAWMDILVNAKDYLRDELHIQILNKCVEELKKHSKNHSDDSVRIEAKRALKILHQVKRSKILEFTKKEHGQNFADNVIYTTVSNLRIRYRVLIITQDKGLASDLRDLNSLESQRGYQVAVYKLLPDSTLDINKGMPAGYVHQNYHAAPVRPDAKKQPHGLRGLFHHDHKTAPAPKPVRDPNEGLNKVIENDKKLSSTLSNPTYPTQSKLNDIDAQLKAIQSLPEDKKTGLKLILNDARLHEEKTKLLQAKTAPKAAPVAVSEPVKPQPAAPALKAMVNPVVKEASAQQPTTLLRPQEKHLFYGEGHSLEYALEQCAQHYGILFRDPSIPYVNPVHGPLDVTEKDEAQISAALKEGKGEILVHGALFKAEKNAYGYKVFIDLHPESTPVAPKVTPNVEKQAVPVAKVAANPAPIAPKAAPEKPAKKASQPAPTPLTPSSVPASAKPTTLKKEVVHRKAAAPKKAVVAPSAPAGTGKGATLIVAVPSDDNEREFIERKSRRAAENSETIHPVRPNDGSKPTKKTVARGFKSVHQKSQKAMNTKTAPKKQPVAAPSRDRPDPHLVQPKTGPGPRPRVAKNVAKPQNRSDAKASELRLRANFSNPNYPKASKIKDVADQIALVRSLKASEAAGLALKLADLEKMQKTLK